MLPILLHVLFYSLNVAHGKVFNSPLHLFLDNEFDSINAPELKVHIEEQLRLEVCVQSVFPASTHGVTGDTENRLQILHISEIHPLHRFCMGLVHFLSVGCYAARYAIEFQRYNSFPRLPVLNVAQTLTSSP